MRIIDITHPPKDLWVGRESENRFRPVSFECANWFEAYPNATIVAYYQPYATSDPYPLVLTADGTKRIWHPTATELVKGNGEMQIVLMLGDVVGTSAIIPTRVDRSLISSADHPAEDAPSWTVQVVQDVTEQADRAEEAASHYPKIVNGVWYVWNVQDEDYVSTGIEAQGEDGYSPTVTVTEIEGGHRVTITDADGAHTFDVMDGEGGSGGAVDSVNGKTGAVVLDASDVGALPDDTPIPAAVTEQTVAGWGFTKNTGDYTKPSGGIPKTDLASAVQTSLGKADTAVQPSAISDMATKTWVDGKGYQTAAQVQAAIDGIPDELPAVSASDNGKFLRVVNGAWAAQAVPFQTPRVAMTASDTTPSLDPNKLYVFPTMASLAPTLATPTDSNIVNEYHFIFTSGATATTLSIPATVNQPDGFSVDANMVYEVSILENNMTAMSWAVSA